MAKEQIPNDKLLLFHEVIKLLKEFNVNYWLDQGSLLGAVRNNAFITWDHDVDMGVWHNDMDILKKIAARLTAIGARVSFFQYAVKIKFKKNDISSIPVNIRFYYKKDGYAFSEFWGVMNKKSIFNKTLKILKNYSSKSIYKIYESERHHTFVNRVLIFIYRLLFNVSLFLREVLKVRRVIFRTDEKYFVNFKDKRIYGVNVRIPEKPEKYLEFKYGKDWKKPVKEWVWWKDDGALFRNDLFRMSVFGFRKRLNMSK